MGKQGILMNHFGWMLAQIPRTEVALAVFREAIRTKNNSLINSVLHSLSQDLGANYVSRWLVEEALPTLSAKERIYLNSLIQD